MKIYNEVVIDIATGKTISEDSYEYDGPVMLLQGGETDPSTWSSDFIVYTTSTDPGNAPNHYAVWQYDSDAGSWSQTGWQEGEGDAMSEDEAYQYYVEGMIDYDTYQEYLQSPPGADPPSGAPFVGNPNVMQGGNVSPSDFGFSQWEISTGNEWRNFGDAPTDKIGASATPDISELTQSLSPDDWMTARAAATGETETELTREASEFTEDPGYTESAYAQGYGPSVSTFMDLRGIVPGAWFDPASKDAAAMMEKTWQEMGVPQRLRSYAPAPAKWEEWGLPAESLAEYWDEPPLGVTGELMRGAQETMEGVPLRQAGFEYGGTDPDAPSGKMAAKPSFVPGLPGSVAGKYQDVYLGAEGQIQTQQEAIDTATAAETSAMDVYEALLAPSMSPAQYEAGIAAGDIDPATGVGLTTPDILSAQAQGATAIGEAEADVTGAEIGAAVGAEALYAGLYSPGGSSEQLQDAFESNIISAETAAEGLLGGASGYIPGMEAQELGWQQGLERWGQELGEGEEAKERAFESIKEEAYETAGAAGDKLVGLKLGELAQSYAKGGAEFGSPMGIDERAVRKQHGLAVKDIAERRGIQQEDWSEMLSDYGFEEVGDEIVPILTDPNNPTSYQPGSVIGQAHEARTTEEQAMLQSTLGGLASGGFEVDPSLGMSLEQYYASLAGTDWTAEQIAQDIIPTGWTAEGGYDPASATGSVGTYLQNYLTGMSGAEQNYMDQLLQHGGYWNPNANSGQGGFVSFDPAGQYGPTSVLHTDPITGEEYYMEYGLPGGTEEGWWETGPGAAQTELYGAQALWGVPDESGAYPLGSNIGDVMSSEAQGIAAGQLGYTRAGENLATEQEYMTDYLEPHLFGAGTLASPELGQGILGQARGEYGLWAPGSPWTLQEEGGAQLEARGELEAGWQDMLAAYQGESEALASGWGGALQAGIGEWYDPGWTTAWSTLAGKDAG